ncbi:MAG: hypothetical protein F7C33_03215 [Desulfurococcales archaeon]|nr:hypothetical protein [Desulfurococcales archaeon]
MRPGIACADAPHHITSIFLPIKAKTLEETGSIGVGLAVEPRLTVCTGASRNHRISTIHRVVRLLGLDHASLQVTTPLPPGSGYAVSAASAVSAALALISGRRPVREAYLTAHLAEILEGTGLGDVLALSCGVGIVLRKSPGAPGVGSVDCVQLPGTVSILSVDTGRMHTSRMLSSLNSSFLEKAKKYLDKIFDENTFESFAYYSELFSKESGMLYAALGGRELPRIPGKIAVYGKKKVVVFLVERDRLSDAIEALEKWGARPRLLEASSGPPRVWWA